MTTWTKETLVGHILRKLVYWRLRRGGSGLPREYCLRKFTLVHTACEAFLVVPLAV